MAQDVAILQVFNRGVVSALGLGRTDLKRTGLSAEKQLNWMPRVLGAMSLRPGMEYIGSTKSDATAKFIPFIFSNEDTAMIEVTDEIMRVWVDEAVVTRVSVSTAVTNGTFTSNLNDWTDSDEAGGTSSWLTGGYMQLVGNGTAAAIRTQEVTVGASDQNKVHALRIVVTRGTVLFRVGSTSGAQDYVSETTLGEGTHSLAFTPTGNFHIKVSSQAQAASLVDSITVESAGTLELPVVWTDADLDYLRWHQSADVIYVACDGYHPYKIERRGTTSWSIVKYQPSDGPFLTENVTTTTITASALNGDITLTASTGIFRSGHVGALYRISSIGQRVEVEITAENTFSDPIRVDGVDSQRAFLVQLSGTWTATVTLQRSVGEPGTWVDVNTYSANTTVTVDDGFDNQIIYYRIGVKTGDFTSGTLDAALSIDIGSITGVCRITGFTNETTVSARVLTALGSTEASEIWAEGSWSDYAGWPSAVLIYEGRLWWFGKGSAWGSVSDAYETFDPDFEGDAGTINRFVGSGPVDHVNWALPLLRLLVGTDAEEISCRSSAFDEPLTPTNFNPKAASTQGSSAVAAVKLDSRGIFVDKSKRRLYELAYNPAGQDYDSTDLTVLCPEIAESNIVRIAVQRKPDTRIHCIMGDGTAAVLVFDRAEDVICWVTVESGTDDIEDVVVMPGEVEDRVYYLVERTINGSTKRYLEKWALETECRGGTVNKQLDSFKTFTNGSASASVTGLSHLEGESVAVWADGKCLTDADGDVATFTVSSGAITLTDGGSSYLATTGVVGLAYTAQYKSVKLAQVASSASALTQRKRIPRLGLILANTHARGLQYGPDFTYLDELPQIENGTTVSEDHVWEQYDKDTVEFNGTWDTDSRVCLQANAPRPATVLALVVELGMNPK